MKGGKAKCLNASHPTELHGWKENSVDGRQLGSAIDSSAKKTCGVESAYARRVNRFTQQPNFLAEAWSSNGLAFRHFALVTFICASNESDRRPGATGGLSPQRQNHIYANAAR